MRKIRTKKSQGPDPDRDLAPVIIALRVGGTDAAIKAFGIDLTCRAAYILLRKKGKRNIEEKAGMRGGCIGCFARPRCLYNLFPKP